MEYIQPSTTVKVLRGIPLENNYINTLYFNSREDQYNYFILHEKYSFSPLTYQRHSAGSIKVEIAPENLYDCNYLMFNNANFGTRWFYAFIIDTEYVNNKTAIIYYELDVMQTYHFDYILVDTFVEREHSATDVIGENTVPENLEIGPYTTTVEDYSLLATSFDLCLYSTVNIMENSPDPDPLITPIPPQLFYNTPIPCYLYRFPYNEEGFASLKTVIDRIVSSGPDAANSIISVFAVPNNLVSAETCTPAGVTKTLPPRTLAGGNKSVKNKKLFTYPYCACVAVGSSDSVVLKYEEFNDNTPTVALNASFGPNPSILLTPINYENISRNTMFQVASADWPILPWICDNWQTFMGNTKLARGVAKNVAFGAVALGGMATIGSALAGAGAVAGAASYAGAIGTGVKAVVSTVGGKVAGGAIAAGIATAVGKAANSYITPDTLNGSAMAGDTNVFCNLAGFKLYCRSIKKEYIKIVDNYFNRYGYKTNLVKIPNRNVRPHWTYTKTIGSDVQGFIPSVYKGVIDSIFDSGITFWNNPSEVGNYSLDNSV